MPFKHKVSNSGFIGIYFETKAQSLQNPTNRIYFTNLITPQIFKGKYMNTFIGFPNIFDMYLTHWYFKIFSTTHPYILYISLWTF